MKLSRMEWILFAITLLLLVALSFLLGMVFRQSLGGHEPEVVIQAPVPSTTEPTTEPTTEATTEPTTEPITEPVTEATTEATEDPTAPLFDGDALKLEIAAVLEECSGPWAVYAEEINSGASVFCGKEAQARDPMIGASMIKMFIMAKTYELIELGVLAEEDVYDDMYDMITISDNDDTNRLTRQLGHGSTEAGRALVTDFAARMGCPEVQHNRLMLDFNGYENYVSVGACAKLLRMIYEGTCVSEEASEAMLEILLGQTDRNYIPAGVPDDVRIALKGGDLPNCQGDSAIVFLEGNPYIVCIITNSSHSDYNEQKIGEISGLIYRAMAGGIEG